MLFGGPGRPTRATVICRFREYCHVCRGNVAIGSGAENSVSAGFDARDESANGLASVEVLKAITNACPVQGEEPADDGDSVSAKDVGDEGTTSVPTTTSEPPVGNESPGQSFDDDTMVASFIPPVTYLDRNFKSYTLQRQPYISSYCHDMFLRAVVADTELMRDHDLIDYSMMVGIDLGRQEVVVELLTTWSRGELSAKWKIW